MFIEVIKLAVTGDRTIRLNPNAVAYYYASEAGSTVTLISGENFQIRDTPAQIAAACEGGSDEPAPAKTARKK